MRKILLTISAGLLLSQCVSSLIRKSFSQDQLFVSIVAASLFNQRTTNVDRNWQGDWVLRRERLHLIDSEFLQLQPDILVLQEILQKTSSAFDSDQKILTASSLADFQWSTSSVHYYGDTDEEEFMAFATKPGFLKERSLAAAEQYSIGQNGVVAFNTIPLANQPPLAIGNIYLPNPSSEELGQLKERISTFLTQQNLCAERLVLAGSLGEGKSTNIREFLNHFNLKDSKDAYCENGECLPAVRNTIFKSSTDEKNSPDSFTIFSPESSQISETALVFAKAQESKLFSDKYHFDQLWPTAKLGWMTRAKYARCQ